MANRLTPRATVLLDWRGTDSYALVQTMLQELYDDRLARMLEGTQEHFERHAGVLEGLRMAQRLAEQTLLDERRSREREETDDAH